MKRMGYLRAAIAVIGLTVLLSDSRCAVEGAKSGIDLCIKTVIPSLLPFLILSTMLTGSLDSMDGRLCRYTADILQIPRQAATVLIPAFLGGYPVGAKSAADLYRNGSIEKKQAEQILAFCNNAGPSFLFGMVSVFFPDKRMVFGLWGIHALSAVLTGKILTERIQVSAENCRQKRMNSSQDLMMTSCKAMAVICGWIILMRTLISFLNAWILWMIPQWLQVLLVGILELSNGCCELLRIENLYSRFVLCSCILALGGVCVLLQTVSVTKGLSLRKYVMGKLLQTVLSFILSCVFLAGNPFLSGLTGLLSVIIILKPKNTCRNLQCYPV